MASEHVIPGPPSGGEAGEGFFGSPKAPSVNVAGSGFNPSVAPGRAAERAGAGEADRFQPGALRPAGNATPGGRRGRQSGARASQAGSHRRMRRMFDLALLAAELVSATIVVWLVAQYVFTVYFDTAPRRATPPSGSGAYSGAAQGASGLGLATSTPTRIAQVTPAQGGPDGVADDMEGGGDYRAGGKHRGVGAARAGVPTLTPTATATVAPNLLLPSRLRIPVMFLDSPVHEVVVNMGVWEVSPMRIGHHGGTANPGETGNVVLAGHRDINSALFRDLDRLKPGDDVLVSNSLREYRYVVKESFVVSPDHTEVMDPTDDKRVTLITCTPIGLATQRLVVTAILDEQTGTR